MNRIGWLGSFMLSAAAGLTMAIDASSQTFNSARVAIVLLALLLLHLVKFGRIVVVREALMYACFLAYMLVEMLWTADRGLAMNTLVPAANFLIALILFGSLVANHNLHAVLAGTLFGVLAGAASYSLTSGFPFRIPTDFSYNAVAGMYLFGLIMALLLASVARKKALLVILAGVIWMHVVATTSIKTNVGILLGAATAGAVHFSYVSRLLWRHALAVLAIGIAIAVAVASNNTAVETIQRGTDRIALGIQILQAREDLPGYSAFERRAKWQREGVRGWLQNPVFGYGVESFRSDFGITSHASHVDILYNSGLIGITLFYGMFVSVMLRLRRARQGDFRNARLVVLGGTVCALFMSFAGTIHYSAGLAAFLALGIGILKRSGGQSGIPVAAAIGQP